MSSRVVSGMLPFWMLLGLFLGSVMSGGSAVGFELKIEAEQIDSRIESRAARHKIFLGRLKKISNLLDPEALQLVQGVRHYETYRTAPDVSLDEVILALQSETESQFETRFMCQGRDCGSSNEWANAVFDEPKLYGLENSQYYWVGQNRQSGRYWRAYISKRSNKPVHYRLEWFVGDGLISSSQRIEQALEEQGFARLALEDAQRDMTKLGEDLSAWCQRSGQGDIAIVVSKSDPTGTIYERLTDSQTRADEIMAELDGESANCRFTAHGLGPLSPQEGWLVPRLDLILLRQ